MKSFSISILALLFIVACGTEAETEPETETVRIGSFDVVTNLETGQTRADWIGENSTKMKSLESDTVWFDSPDGHSISIHDASVSHEGVYYPEYEDMYYFEYIDSTQTDYEVFTDWKLITPFPFPGSSVGSPEGGGYVRVATFYIEYACGEDPYSDFADDEAIEFWYEIDDYRKVHYFNLPGMIDAIEYAVCHD